MSISWFWPDWGSVPVNHPRLHSDGFCEICWTECSIEDSCVCCLERAQAYEAKPGQIVKLDQE